MFCAQMVERIPHSRESASIDTGQLTDQNTRTAYKQYLPVLFKFEDFAMFCLFIFLLTLITVPAEEYKPCGGKPADVFFVLDSSGSIRADDFVKELNFTRDLTSMFDTSPGRVRVGVLSFSQHVTPQILLGEYSSKEDLLNKIESVTYEGRGTNTGEALSYLHTKGLSKERVREGIPHIGIVLTDGMSQDMEATLREASAVHDAGIIVFVIGIGSQVDNMELAAIGSKPSSKFVRTIDSFDALDTIRESLAMEACTVAPATPAPQMQNTEALVEEELISAGSCTPWQPLDLVFAVDTAAIGAANARYVLEFISNISQHLNMAAGDISISAVTSGCPSGEMSDAPAYNPDDVQGRLAQFPTPQYDKLLRAMRLKAIKSRPKTQHIGVLFVANWLNPREYQRSTNELNRARFQGVGTFVFGVGGTYDEAQAQGLVTQWGSFYPVFSFHHLDEMGKAFLYDLCLYQVDMKQQK